MKIMVRMFLGRVLVVRARWWMYAVRDRKPASSTHCRIRPALYMAIPVLTWFAFEGSVRPELLAAPVLTKTSMMTLMKMKVLRTRPGCIGA